MLIHQKMRMMNGVQQVVDMRVLAVKRHQPLHFLLICRHMALHYKFSSSLIIENVLSFVFLESTLHFCLDLSRYCCFFNFTWRVYIFIQRNYTNIYTRRVISEICLSITNLNIVFGYFCAEIMHFN